MASHPGWRRVARRFLIVVGALAVALLIAELVLRMTVGVQGRFEWHAAAGYANRSHADFEMRERRVRTGADGRIAPVVPGEGRPSLLVIGDSYAAGQAAPWPDGCFELATTMLAQERPGYWSINLGTSGYGTDQSLLRMREFLDPPPERVVYMLFDNDLRDNEDTLHFGMSKPRFAVRDGELEQIHWPSRLNVLLLESALAGWVARPFIDPDTQMIGWRDRTPAQRAELAREIVRVMREEAEGAGAQFSIVAHWEALLPEPDEAFKLLLDQLEADGIPMLVLNRRIELAPYYDQPRWHWNAEGHRLAGIEIARWLGELDAPPIEPR